MNIDKQVGRVGFGLKMGSFTYACLHDRIQIHTRSQDALQKDHQLFHATLQDSRNEEAGHHTRIVIVGHWIGTLSQNIDPIGTYNSIETGKYDIYIWIRSLFINL